MSQVVNHLHTNRAGRGSLCESCEKLPHIINIDFADGTHATLCAGCLNKLYPDIAKLAGFEAK